MTTWKTGTPSKDDLRVIFQREDYVCLGGEFLVTNGHAVWIESFIKPPQGKSAYYPGYWKNDEIGDIKGWMYLPSPKMEEEK